MEEEKVWMAARNLEDDARVWFLQVQQDEGTPVWRRFTKLLPLRFGSPPSCNLLHNVSTMLDRLASELLQLSDQIERSDRRRRAAVRLQAAARQRHVDSWHAGGHNLSVRRSVWLCAHQWRSRQRCAYKLQGEVSLLDGWRGRCACCSAHRCRTCSSTRPRPYILWLQLKWRSEYGDFQCSECAMPSSNRHRWLWPSRLLWYPPWCWTNPKHEWAGTPSTLQPI